MKQIAAGRRLLARESGVEISYASCGSCKTFGLLCKQLFGWHWSTCAHWMWKDNIVIVMMEPWRAQTMTFGSGSGWWNDISVKLNCGFGRAACAFVFLQALCIFGLNRCLAGRSDALRAWVCYRHAGDSTGSLHLWT